MKWKCKLLVISQRVFQAWSEQWSTYLELCLNLRLLLQCSWKWSLFLPPAFLFKKLMLSHHTCTVHIESGISCKGKTKEVSNYTWRKQSLLSLRRFLSCYKHEHVTFGGLEKNFFTAALILADPILYKIYILTFAHGWFGKCLGPVTWSTLTFWERCADHKIKPAGFFSL